MKWRRVVWLCLASGALAGPMCAIPPLIQLPGTAGCTSETGDGGLCADGVALESTGSATVSPDGRNVYVTSQSSDAVATFDRDPIDGALTQKAGTSGCVSETGSGG